MTTPLRIALIIGSTRDGRFGPNVARWFEAVASARSDIELDVIDLLEADLPAHWTSELAPVTRAMVQRLDEADAFVVVTPEYNHSFPASLKQAIDISGGVWTRKPVGFVSYGGLSGGLRAVEQLRVVFAEARATTVRETVSFHMFPFDEAGQPVDVVMSERAATTMLDDLVWWGNALRTARHADQAWREAS
jgi:NAD(P)H-dependent FMN reductase